MSSHPDAIFTRAEIEALLVIMDNQVKNPASSDKVLRHKLLRHKLQLLLQPYCEHKALLQTAPKVYRCSWCDKELVLGDSDVIIKASVIQES